jgi:hypothetical protein
MKYLLSINNWLNESESSREVITALLDFEKLGLIEPGKYAAFLMTEMVPILQSAEPNLAGQLAVLLELKKEDKIEDSTCLALTKELLKEAMLSDDWEKQIADVDQKIEVVIPWTDYDMDKGKGIIQELQSSGISAKNIGTTNVTMKLKILKISIRGPLNAIYRELDRIEYPIDRVISTRGITLLK